MCFVFVVMKVKPEVICADIPTSVVPAWQHLLKHLSSYWLPGNADIDSLYCTVLQRKKDTKRAVITW